MTLILDREGKPAVPAGEEPCPRCAAGLERRGPSGGFGAPHPVCFNCGHEWHGVVWKARPSRETR